MKKHLGACFRLDLGYPIPMPLPPEPQPGLREPLTFHKSSFVTLAVLLAVIITLVLGWPDLAAAEWHQVFDFPDWWNHVDWLLAGLGVFFLFCTVFDANPRLDLATVTAGMVGGAIIEVWGTRAGVWHYYTWERPPLWILPAWGMSALANERLQRILMIRLPAGIRERMLTDSAGTAGDRALHFGLFLPLFGFFVWWSRAYLAHPYSWLVAALIFSAFWRPRFPAYGISLFFTGALLGIFLEIWGTTRHCWNYYDGKTPSPFPIFGHGMAAVCFWKMKSLARHLYEANARAALRLSLRR